MNALLKICGAAAFPLGVLNALSGIVSIVWLLFLGDFKTLGIGVAVYFLSSFAIALLMLPGAALSVAMVALIGSVGPRSPVGLVGVGVNKLYHVLAIGSWCLGMLLLFNELGVRNTDNDTMLPYALAGYALAVSPWINVAKQEMATSENAMGTVMAVFFAQLATATVTILGWLGALSGLGFLELYCGILIVGWFIQVYFSAQELRHMNA